MNWQFLEDLDRVECSYLGEGVYFYRLDPAARMFIQAVRAGSHQCMQ